MRSTKLNPSWFIIALISSCIVVWSHEPQPLPHVGIYYNKKPTLVIPQKHEWTVERIKKNREQRRKKT